MTYYAVRRGRKTGIYTEWDECRQQIDGYPDASYRKFDNKQAAYRFLVGYKNKTTYRNAMMPASLYVNGFYSEDDKAYRCDATLLENGNTHRIEQYGFEYFELKEQAGGILGLFEGIKLAVSLGVPEVDVTCSFDLASLPEQNDYVIKLKSYINRLKPKIKLTFFQPTKWE